MSHLCLLLQVEKIEKCGKRTCIFLQIFDTKDDIVVRRIPIVYGKHMPIEDIDEYKTRIVDVAFDSIPKFITWLQTTLHEFHRDDVKIPLRFLMTDKPHRELSFNIANEAEAIQTIMNIVKTVDGFLKSGTLKTLVQTIVKGKRGGCVPW